jgi:hypothetical protein
MNKDMYARKHVTVTEIHGHVCFSKCYKVSVCLQVLEMAAFSLDSQSGPFQRAYRNGWRLHHAGSTSNGLCVCVCVCVCVDREREIRTLLRVMVVHLRKS